MTDLAAKETDSRQGLTQVIQASYEIISILERSKEQLEEIIDDFPDVFCVIDKNGSILRGNRRLAKLFNRSVDDLLYIPLRRLFSANNYLAMQARLESIADCMDTHEFMEFELEVDGLDFDRRSYLWLMRPLTGSGDDGVQLVTLIGRDVSQLRKFEQQLTVQKQIEVLYAATRDLALMRTKAAACGKFLEYLLSFVDLEHDFSAAIYFAPSEDAGGSVNGWISLDLALDGAAISESELSPLKKIEVPWLSKLTVESRTFLDPLRNLAIPVQLPGQLVAVLRVGPCTMQWSPREVDFYFLDTLAISLGIAIDNIRYMESQLERARLSDVVLAKS